MSDSHEHDGEDIYIKPHSRVPYGFLPDIIDGLADRLDDALERIDTLEREAGLKP